ncbi:hypothetical protein [Nocardia iowensis]|uniref:PH domain-containing protein n=1 Tax=Nocardia iowensis TaxID=204891 RepID=A0ABX8RYK8_NOCIO|nr:hypothetical protein [Nocardia iowensis]QXN94648.1 hypothetical protein KV110_17295 [Nocardia iowensis]
MTQVVKVFTPIKRVPTVIGKAQNGQRLPFGPYTLPQVVGGMVLLLLTSTCALTFPFNPAITFGVGVLLTVATVFGLGLIPYTGVRLTSRVLWIGRLILIRRPVSASGIAVISESGRNTMYIDESTVLFVPPPIPGEGEGTARSGIERYAEPEEVH